MTVAFLLRVLFFPRSEAHAHVSVMESAAPFAQSLPAPGRSRSIPVVIRAGRFPGRAFRVDADAVEKAKAALKALRHCDPAPMKKA